MKSKPKEDKQQLIWEREQENKISLCFLYRRWTVFSDCLCLWVYYSAHDGP